MAKHSCTAAGCEARQAIIEPRRTDSATRVCLPACALPVPNDAGPTSWLLHGDRR